MATAPDSPSGPSRVAVCDVRLPNDRPPTLRLRLFYPTSALPSTPRATWFPPPPPGCPDSNVASILRFAGVPLPKLAAVPLTHLADLPVPAAAVGPLPPPPTPRLPVVIFSHGLGGAVGNYSNFCIDCASHGALVIAPEHTDGSAFSAVLGDGTVIPYIRYSRSLHGPFDRDWRRRQIDTRVADMQAVLRTLVALNAGDPQTSLVPLRENRPAPLIANRLDLSDVVFAGHSFGAATALVMATEKLPRGIAHPRAVICLDPWLFALGDTISQLKFNKKTSILFVDMANSDMGSSLKAREKIEHVGGEEVIVDAVKILGALHNNASDFPLRLPRLIALLAKMTAAKSDPKRILELQNLVTRTFLKGSEAWLELREAIARGEEEGVALATLGAGRALPKRREKDGGEASGLRNKA